MNAAGLLDAPGRVSARGGAGRGYSSAASEEAARQAAGLLGHVLARLPGVAQPVVHVLPACPAGNAFSVARVLAAAAAERFGRTLLVRAGVAETRQAEPGGLWWLAAELPGYGPDAQGHGPEAIVPDAGTEGLYHTRTRLADRGGIAQKLAAWCRTEPGFRMVVVESPSATIDPEALDTCLACHGAVLAVAAGRTTLQDLRRTERQLEAAGARVLGTVLHDRPIIGLPGLRRRGLRRRRGV